MYMCKNAKVYVRKCKCIRKLVVLEDQREHGALQGVVEVTGCWSMFGFVGERGRGIRSQWS